MGSSFRLFAAVTGTAAALALTSLAATPAAFAEQAKKQANNGSGQKSEAPSQAPSREQAQALPPALQAALVSGNPQALDSALKTLSGGDPAKLVSLSERLIVAAEQILQTNPKAAIQAAAVAVNTIREQPVQQSSPPQAQNVITTAARIFISPIAEKTDPDRTAALANATVTAAQNSNNTSLVASIASQSISLAERILVVNPQMAIQMASASLKVVQNLTVQSTAPADAMQVASTASRIILNPEVQRVAPQEVAAMAASASQVATSPVVYAAAPSVAVTVMANSYQTANSAVIQSAAPEAVASVRTVLTAAADSSSLNQSNDKNPAQIDNILKGNSADTTQETEKTTPTDVTDLKIGSSN